MNAEGALLLCRATHGHDGLQGFGNQAHFALLIDRADRRLRKTRVCAQQRCQACREQRVAA